MYVHQTKVTQTQVALNVLHAKTREACIQGADMHICKYMNPTAEAKQNVSMPRRYPCAQSWCAFFQISLRLKLWSQWASHSSDWGSVRRLNFFEDWKFKCIVCDSEWEYLFTLLMIIAWCIETFLCSFQGSFRLICNVTIRAWSVSIALHVGNWLFINWGLRASFHSVRKQLHLHTHNSKHACVCVYATRIRSYICTHVWTQTCIHVYTYRTQTCTHTHTHTQTHTQKCVYICICICIYVCMYICIYVYMYICIYTRTREHTQHAHTHTHTHVHIYIYIYI
jgi:hypothetical protein